MHPRGQLDLRESLFLADLSQPVGAGLCEQPVLVLSDGILTRGPLGANLVPGPGPLRGRSYTGGTRWATLADGTAPRTLVLTVRHQTGPWLR